MFFFFVKFNLFFLGDRVEVSQGGGKTVILLPQPPRQLGLQECATHCTWFEKFLMLFSVSTVWQWLLVSGYNTEKLTLFSASTSRSLTEACSARTTWAPAISGLGAAPRVQPQARECRAPPCTGVSAGGRGPGSNPSADSFQTHRGHRFCPVRSSVVCAPKFLKQSSRKHVR